MELAFVISALRRRFWLVILFAVLGSVPGLRSDGPAGRTYESVAKLSVIAPTRANVNVFSSNPDRYVLSQLAVLESESMTVDVAARVNGQVGDQLPEPLSPAAVTTLTTIEQDPETDIVTIAAQADNPDLAQLIAQAYVDLYTEGLATTVDDEAQRQALDTQIAELENQLDAVDVRMATSMEKYLPKSGVANPAPIPPVESVDPQAASDRELLLAQLLQLQSARTDLDADSRLRVNTEVIAAPLVPTEALPAGSDLLLAGGLLAGGVFGVVVALLWARFSTKVLDEVSVGEILGAPVASDLPHYRSIARDPLAAFQALPRSAVPTIDQLCVRAEALARIGEPLTVLVTGTMRNAGSTTVALAMAERFAAGGASVVLVDADVRDPRVTALFNATADGGVPSVIANDGATVDQRGRSAFTRTMDPAVAVLGLGPNRGSAALRRDTVPSVLEVCRRKAEIVVVDGGPVLDLASTIQFAYLADAVVLAVPLSRQKADSLGDLGRQLESVRGKMLPVVTSPPRRSSGGEIVSSDGAIATQGAGSAGQPLAGAGQQHQAQARHAAAQQAPAGQQPHPGAGGYGPGRGGGQLVPGQPASPATPTIPNAVPNGQPIPTQQSQQTQVAPAAGGSAAAGEGSDGGQAGQGGAGAHTRS